MASLALPAVIACSPSLAPALLALWVVALALTAVRLGGRGIGRVVWIFVPTVVIFAPLVWRRLRLGDGWAVFADPGVVAPTGGPGADLLGRLTDDPVLQRQFDAFHQHVAAHRLVEVETLADRAGGGEHFVDGHVEGHVLETTEVAGRAACRRRTCTHGDDSDFPP